MNAEKKKYRIYKETEKHQQVTHWDLDYLPGEKVRELYEQKVEPKSGNCQICNRLKDRHLPLCLIAAGLFLLMGSLFVISRL